MKISKKKWGEGGVGRGRGRGRGRVGGQGGCKWRIEVFYENLQKKFGGGSGGSGGGSGWWGIRLDVNEELKFL